MELKQIVAFREQVEPAAAFWEYQWIKIDVAFWDAVLKKVELSYLLPHQHAWIYVSCDTSPFYDQA